MTTLIAWGNINQPYAFADIPPHLLTDKLRAVPQGNARILQRHKCRQLAHFLLWQLLQQADAETAQNSTALLGQIAYTDSGRPQFPAENLDFNITHSGDWVAVMLNVNEGAAPSSAVGIDIEFPQRPRDFSALLTHFATTHEQQWFAQQPNSEAAFYRIWCLREAVLKSQGVGIVKLSEVQHDPLALTLKSAYCPQGQLLFSDELPFYFAAFGAGKSLQNAQYFAWQNGRLASVQLQRAVNYQVNMA